MLQTSLVNQIRCNLVFILRSSKADSSAWMKRGRQLCIQLMLFKSQMNVMKNSLKLMFIKFKIKFKP